MPDLALGHQGRDERTCLCRLCSKGAIPELTPGTVVILDSLATHRNIQAAQAMNEAECWFLYLPPHSPDLNPIKQVFSKLKSHLRKAGARTFTDLFSPLGDICRMFTPDECWNYLEATGHAPR